MKMEDGKGRTNGRKAQPEEPAATAGIRGKEVNCTRCAQVLLSVCLMTGLLMAEAGEMNVGWPGGSLFRG